MLIYAPEDAVVDQAATAEKAAKWAAPHAIIEVTDSADPSQHVIAGDILSPNTTGRLAAETAAWIRGLNL